MLRLPVLQELCAGSRSRQSDPRSICTTSDVLDTTPVTTIRLLQSMKEADRCLWTLRGQVVFVKRLKVSLRCRTCKVRASPLPNRCDCVFSCSRCHSQLSLFPLWEASIAFDDGTGECNLSVEDQAVFSFIRSRFDDPRGVVLADVKVMVDEYVHRRGMLEYDSYERSDVSNSKSKPYQWLVDEGAERVDAGAGPLQEEKKKMMPGAAVFEVLQLPEEEKGRRSRRSGVGMVSSFDLKENPDGVHAVDVLRAYLELGSCCNNLEVTCILSNSSSSSGGCGSSSSGAAMRTRDLKVQRNNEVDRPYLASFEMRPVGVDSRKLSMDCYAVRELKGSLLIDRIRSMMGNVP